MITFGMITKQGQITIPAKARRLLGLQKNRRVVIKVEDNKIIMEKEPDVMDLAGIWHGKALKGKTIEEIMAIEKKAIEDAYTERALRIK